VQQLRRPFDVGEEQRDRPRRELTHGTMIARAESSGEIDVTEPKLGSTRTAAPLSAVASSHPDSVR
jgi:hypothetical protein